MIVHQRPRIRSWGIDFVIDDLLGSDCLLLESACTMEEILPSAKLTLTQHMQMPNAIAHTQLGVSN